MVPRGDPAADGAAISADPVPPQSIERILRNAARRVIHRDSRPPTDSQQQELGSSRGGSDPNFDKVAGNIAYRDHPADLMWDGTGTGVSFTGNHCAVSHPSGLCH